MKKINVKKELAFWRTPAILLILLAIMSQFCRPILVSGISMEHTLQDKQYVLGMKTRYSKIARGDIITAKVSIGAKKYTIIKRVIAIPGDTVSIVQNTVYVNGAALDEPYLPEAMDTPDMEKITLGKEEYFAMGDNRNYSTDCREIGTISAQQLDYKIIFRSSN